MKKQKPQENFQKDILDITKGQDDKIQSLVDLVTQTTKTLEGLAELIKAGKQGNTAPTPIQEIGNVVFTDITFTRVVSPEDNQKRANEVAGLVKPILEKYGVAKLNAFLIEKK